MFCGAVLGAPVSFVSGYAGSYFQPGPGYAISYSLPYSSSHSTSQAITGEYVGTYSASESASGTITTASLQVANGYSGTPGTIPYSNFQFVSANSFSGANLLVSGPVYVSESVSVSYSFPSSSNNPGFSESLGFYDNAGNLIGTGCTVPTSSSGLQGTAGCSTGLVYIESSSNISINSSLGASVVAFSPGDAASFQGAATLGLLDVYDTNGRLIEAIDLNSLATATPEPGSAAFSSQD